MAIADQIEELVDGARLQPSERPPRTGQGRPILVTLAELGCARPASTCTSGRGRTRFQDSLHGSVRKDPSARCTRATPQLSAIWPRDPERGWFVSRHPDRRQTRPNGSSATAPSRSSMEPSNRTIGAGTVLGEVSMFSPDRRRTATAICASDGELLVMSEDKVRQLYFQNPKFGFYLVQLITARLLENCARIETLPPACRSWRSRACGRLPDPSLAAAAARRAYGIPGAPSFSSGFHDLPLIRNARRREVGGSGAASVRNQPRPTATAGRIRVLSCLVKPRCTFEGAF
jgi:CRP-like cAMP-binding protein